MKRLFAAACVVAFLWQVPAVAGTVDDLLAKYQSQGAGPFDAAAGEAFWTRDFNPPGADKARNCTTCHGNDLSTGGKHVRTGKAIKPMAPSVNPERLTDARKVEKWFMRNCKWVVGRECTPQEKGNVLTFLRSQ